jgi:hypothetical protein
MPDGCYLSMPSGTYPSLLNCADDKIISHTDKSYTEIYYKDFKDNFNLIIEKEKKKLLMKDFG